MEIVKLTPRTHKGKNRLAEAKKKMHGTWDGAWVVTIERKTLPGGAQGPWLFVQPLGGRIDITNTLSRWVHETGDMDFTVVRSNAKSEGADAASSRTLPLD